MVLLDGAGRTIQQRDAEADGRVRLDNLYLLPGRHWLRLRATDADYEVRALPLGPPVESPATDEVVAEILTTMPTDPAADLPTFPVTEREPNDDESRAHLLRFGVAQSGALNVPDDRDLYRFYLGAEEYVRITVTSPLDGLIDMDLPPFFSNAQPAQGESQQVDLLLPPGDHLIHLRGAEPGEAPYRILLERLDPLSLPLDLEPTNNTQAGAQAVTTLAPILGAVPAGDVEDWYRLPPAAGSQLVINAEGAIQNLNLSDGEDWLRDYRWDNNAGTLSGPALPDGPLDLRVRASGPYTLNLRFDPALVDVAEPASLPVTLELLPTAESAAGFWHEGQRIPMTLRLTNTGSEAEQLTLDAVSSDWAWQPRLTTSEVALAPGESTVVDLIVEILPDVPAEVPVQLSVRARNGAGDQATILGDLRRALWRAARRSRSRLHVGRSPVGWSERGLERVRRRGRRRG